MSTFITPTLVQRYLKAMGWISESRAAPLDPWWFFGNHPPVFGISGGLPMLTEITRIEGDTLPELCARLGILAAAEHEYAMARAVDKEAANVPGGIDKEEYIFAVDARNRSGNALVGLAGIDVDAWKAAR